MPISPYHTPLLQQIYHINTLLKGIGCEHSVNDGSLFYSDKQFRKDMEFGKWINDQDTITFSLVNPDLPLFQSADCDIFLQQQRIGSSQ